MILEVLKYILVVLGIIAVGAFVIWGLVSLILIIVEPKKEEPKETYRHYDDRPVTYEPHAYITKEPEYIAETKAKEPVATEYVPENTEVKELDYAKAIEEERALNANSYDQLTAEEEEFIREKQKNIEERMSNKAVKETVAEETLDLDSIFIDDEEPAKEETQISEDRPVDTTAFDDEKEDDIEALITKILDGDDDLDDSFLMEDEESATATDAQEEVLETVEEPAEEIAVETAEETQEEVAEEAVEESTEEIVEEAQEEAINEQVGTEEETQENAEEVATETTEEVVEETPVEQTEEIAEQVSMLADGQDAELAVMVEEVIANPDDDKVRELTEELARQKEEYEARIAELEQAKSEELSTNGEDNSEKIAELENALEQEKANKDKIAELEKMLAERESEKAALMEENARISKERKSGPALPLEEYEQRLEILKERLKANERDFKLIKKEYLPLAKIKKTLEKDNKKLRRKEALVAKQKVVLYGVNNYVDIDEEKAKKLAEDLDLLEGLRLSVQHCEEVMKANEERYPILENSYNILVETNANLKADIEECNQKIAEIKANMANGEQE